MVTVLPGQVPARRRAGAAGPGRALGDARHGSVAAAAAVSLTRKAQEDLDSDAPPAAPPDQAAASRALSPHHSGDPSDPAEEKRSSAADE